MNYQRLKIFTHTKAQYKLAAREVGGWLGEICDREPARVIVIGAHGNMHVGKSTFLYPMAQEALGIADEITAKGIKRYAFDVTARKDNPSGGYDRKVIFIDHGGLAHLKKLQEPYQVPERPAGIGGLDIAEHPWGLQEDMVIDIHYPDDARDGDERRDIVLDFPARAFDTNALLERLWAAGINVVPVR